MEQQNYKWNKILEYYYEYPLMRFTVRELAKKSRLPVTTVQRYLTEMKKAKILSKNGKLLESLSQKFRKSFFMLDKVVDSGLIEFLELELNSSVIIVFGSIRKGEYDKNSDMDIFVESSSKKDIDLLKFERKIGHKIQLFIESDVNELPSNLKNNVLNGVKLSGYLAIK